MHIRDIQAAITDAVDSVDEFLMKVCALDERVEMHQRLNGVFKAMIHLVDEFSHSLLTTDERTVTLVDEFSHSLLTTDERTVTANRTRSLNIPHQASFCIFELHYQLTKASTIGYCVGVKTGRLHARVENAGADCRGRKCMINPNGWPT